LKVVSDFNSSVPSNFSDSLNISIPSSSTVILGEFELSVDKEGSNVVLKGTAGIQSFLGLPNVIINVLRNGNIIGSVDVSTLAVNELRLATFNIIDINAPIGYHTYTLTAQRLNALLTQANVIGPLTFTGTTVSPAL